MAETCGVVVRILGRKFFVRNLLKPIIQPDD